MSILCEKNCRETIKDSLKNSMSYNEYVNLIHELVQNNSTTGDNISEGLVNVTKLNDRRMKRWNKTLKVSDEVKNTLNTHAKKVTWLVITEGWCGDAAHILPVVNKVSERNENINLRVVLRDENPELMNNFLTNGAKSIPVLIMIDHETGEVVNKYGSRPEILTKMVAQYKEMHGSISAEFKEEIQRWYNKDKGQTTIQELVELL